MNEVSISQYGNVIASLGQRLKDDAEVFRHFHLFLCCSFLARRYDNTVAYACCLPRSIATFAQLTSSLSLILAFKFDCTGLPTLYMVPGAIVPLQDLTLCLHLRYLVVGDFRR